MSTVYIIEELTTTDRRTGETKPMFDFRPAAAYGKLVVLSSGRGPSLLSPAPLVHDFRQKLQDFNDADFLVAVGDPVKIGIAVALASETNRGRVAMLKWDREARNYIQVSFDLRGR